MSDFDDNTSPFDDFDEEDLNTDNSGGSMSDNPDQPPANNRSFMVAIGVIVAIFVIALVGLGAFAAITLPQRNAAQRQEAAQINANNTATVAAATELAFIQSQPTQTEMVIVSSPTPPTPLVVVATLPYTPTPVIVFSSPTTPALATETPQLASAQGMAERTATLSLLMTQAGLAPAQATIDPALAQAAGQVAAASTPTSVPATLAQTGFMEDFGLPVSIGMAALLLVIIFFVRRLRAANMG